MFLKKFELSGRWQFMEFPASASKLEALESGNLKSASVPGSIFTALIESGNIDGKKLTATPENFAWVSEKSWVFSKTFDIDRQFTNADRLDVVFEGLDTVTTIWINGRLLARTDNMFITHRFDVTEYIQPGTNTLTIKFDPAEQHAEQLMNRYPSFSDPVFHAPHRAYLRKAQYQFGWDFAPALPGCGIWRDARLEAVRGARLANVTATTVNCSPARADVKVTIELDTVQDEKYNCELKIAGHGQEVNHHLNFDSGQTINSTLLHIDNPRLWWPAGYGNQNLYKVTLLLRHGGKIIDSAEMNLGLRTVELRHKEGDQPEFMFLINGRQVYIRGANWTPPSMFPGCFTRQKYEALLFSARRANINMLRIWGGGCYESQAFYELCNKLGILVWQDFMFACADYPIQKSLIESVKTEAEQNIARLRNNPCMAVFCGNNEIDWMHAEGRLTKSTRLHSKKIFHGILPKLIDNLAPDIPYIPTTPLGTTKAYKNGRTQTTHQWDFWHGQRTIGSLFQTKDPPMPAFTAEFGIQSLPSTQTTRRFTKTKNMPPPGSYDMEKHNYHITGNHTLYRYITELFPTPRNTDELIYLSQLTQARAHEAYIQTLRAKPLTNSGVLFWQYNEPAAAISWSAVDVDLNPKALYYYVRRLYSSRFIAVQCHNICSATGRSLLIPEYVTILNHHRDTLKAKLRCLLLSLSGKTLDEVILPFSIEPFSSSHPLPLPKKIAEPKCPRTSVLQMSVENADMTVTERLFLYLPDKYIIWPEPEIETKILKISPGNYKIEFASETIIKDISIRANQDIRLSDNYFDLLPHRPQTIHLKSNQTTDIRTSAIWLQSAAAIINSVEL